MGQSSQAGVREADREGLEAQAAVEAVLLTTDRPISADQIAEVLAQAGGGAARGGSDIGGDGGGDGSGGGGATAAGVRQAIVSLNEVYERTGRSFRIESVAGGYRVMTLPTCASVLAAFHRSRESRRLSRAAIETLAIIAYRQPITRAELEAIRGVACGEVLRSLLDRRLITIAGRAEELGRPMLYATTKRFLDTFGLASIKDLPKVDSGKGET